MASEAGTNPEARSIVAASRTYGSERAARELPVSFGPSGGEGGAIVTTAVWRRAGLDLVGPENQDYGKREGRHVDPDGNVIRFGGPPC